MTNNTRRGFLRSILALVTASPTKVGTRFWISKTLTSSAVLNSAATDLTGVSSGRLAIVDVICKCNATGLATGTNFELKTNNAKGLLNFFVTAVSGLSGAVKTIDFANASVTKIKTVLESGKKIQFASSGDDCTGAGTLDVLICLERLDDDATVAVV